MRIFAFLLLLGSLLAPAAHAATLKIATLAPDGTSWMKVMRQAAADIKTETEGRVKIKLMSIEQQECRFCTGIFNIGRKKLTNPGVSDGDFIRTSQKINCMVNVFHVSKVWGWLLINVKILVYGATK